MSTATQALDKRSERWGAWLSPARISVVVIAIFVVLSASIAWKPFHLDSMDFAAAASRTAVSGLPVYYRGEQNAGQYIALYHPPLYIYLLAAWMRIFGPGEAQVRMFGMICALIQGVVVLEILRTLFGKARLDRHLAWFWLLFLLNPYTLQTAGIADIDSTIYGPLLCLALLAALRVSWRDGAWRADAAHAREYALLVALITLCFWAKLTTILFVLPVVFLLLSRKLGWKRAALRTAGVTMGSAAAFLFTYWIYGKITGLPTGYTFAFAWVSFVQRGTSGAGASWAQFATYSHGWLGSIRGAINAAPNLLGTIRDYSRNFNTMVPMMTAWTGLLPWAATGIAIAAVAVKGVRARNKAANHYCLLLVLALFTTLAYCAKTVTFGFAPFKYTFVFWGLIVTAPIVLAFNGLDDNGAERPKNRIEVLGLAVVFVLGLGIAAWRIHDSMILFGIDRYLWAPALPAAVCLAAYAFRRFRYAQTALLGSLLFYCGFQLGVALHQSRVDYATTYDYGQTGFMDTVAFIRLNTAPDDIIASMKDIGYRSQRRYFETYLALYGNEAQAQLLRNTIAAGKIKYAVFTEGRGQDQLAVNPVLGAWIREHFQLVRSFGNYRVYQYSGL